LVAEAHAGTPFMGMSGGNWLGALRRFTVRVGRLMLARLWKSFRGLAFIVF